MGLLELLYGGEADLERALLVEPKSGLQFLPGSARGRVPATGDALSSPAMRELAQSLRKQFDFIIVDLPPLGAVLDAVAAAAFVDGYHMIVEWGRTQRSAVVDILATEPVIASRIIGVSLTKVDVDRLQSYDTHSAYGYTGAYSFRYYHGQ
jgi:succinoglycan biosynthesis transport protein ExoP